MTILLFLTSSFLVHNNPINYYTSHTVKSFVGRKVMKECKQMCATKPHLYYMAHLYQYYVIYSCW